jgi:hypothetical protein
LPLPLAALTSCVHSAHYEAVGETTHLAPEEPKPAEQVGAPEPAPAPARQANRLNLDTSLIPPAGRILCLTNEELYELIEFP